MKNRMYLLALCGLSAGLLLSSCRKKEDFKIRHHVFWFDQATADSLQSLGYTKISVTAFGLPAGARVAPVLDVSEWSAAPPLPGTRCLELQVPTFESDSRHLKYSIMLDEPQIPGQLRGSDLFGPHAPLSISYDQPVFTYTKIGIQ